MFLVNRNKAENAATEKYTFNVKVLAQFGLFCNRLNNVIIIIITVIITFGFLLHLCAFISLRKK